MLNTLNDVLNNVDNFYLGDAPHHLDPFYRNLIDSQASRTTDQTSWKGTTLCIS